MGEDYGSRVILEGAIEAPSQALQEFFSCAGESVFIGDDEVIKPRLGQRKYRVFADALESPTAFPS